MAYTHGRYDDVEAWLSAYSDTAYQTMSHHSAHRRSGANSSTAGLEQLIKQLASLQQSIEDNTGSWGGGKRTPAQVTSDILSSAAEGAKFGVFGNTAGAVGAGVGG